MVDASRDLTIGADRSRPGRSRACAGAAFLVCLLGGCALPGRDLPETPTAPPKELATATVGTYGFLGEAGAASPDPVVSGAGQILMVEVADGESVVRMSSDLEVDVDVVKRDGGSVHAVVGPLGTPALLFPAFLPVDEPPRAVVRVVPSQGAAADPLTPGPADFTFGADFAVDAQSQGTTADSGNNLLQRGLASDVSQFKIEVDNRRPSCHIQGPDGVAQVRVDHRVLPDRWYRVRCSRTRDTLHLTVSSLRGGTPRLVEEVRADGVPTGDLQWPHGVPVSVGGKLAADGTLIRSATDQFNGVIAMPVLQIDE